MPYNSTIKPIKGECIDCVAAGDTSQKYLIANRCQHHYKIHRAHVTSNRKNERESRGKVVRMIGNTEADLTELLADSIELGKWFKERILELAKNPVCMECGAEIPSQFFRHAVAHIFPKAQFPSVRTHKWNYLFLGAGCGCHDKSHTIESFCKMKMWPVAVQRFRLFENDIKEKHKYLTLFKDAI
jgi:hypothetical protein